MAPLRLKPSRFRNDQFVSAWSTGGHVLRKSCKGSDAWRLEERRKETRYTLILRVGVLEQAGKSSLCLVKNISSTGIQLKIYSQPIIDASGSIRVADEPAVRGRILWVKGDTAGMSF